MVAFEETATEDMVEKCSFDYFAEYTVVTELLDADEHSCENKAHVERTLEKLQRILNKYTEQPHLLDPHLEPLLNKMLNVIKNPNGSLQWKEFIFQCLFLLINVRGYKVIIRLFPHEISDLSIALHLLDELNKLHHTRWESHYALLLWLSIIVMLPFDMDRLDGALNSSENSRKPIAERIIDICKQYILVANKSRDAASYLCARFVSRADIKRKYLESIIKWLCGKISNIDNKDWSNSGPMITMALILKHGKREDLLPYVNDILNSLVSVDYYHCEYRLARKYAIKITQRVGLTCLKVRIASWRYNRGHRSLAINSFSNTNGEQYSGNFSSDLKKDYNPTQNLVEPFESINKDITPLVEDYKSTQNVVEPFESINEDITPLVEIVIAYLLEALRNEDNTVRWSAAKGIGRITNRLTSEYGDEVVDNVLTLFGPRENSYAWHGGCLALAELGRRGLLLPKRLPAVVDVLMEALIYDTWMKGFTVCQSVRDAACYTTWALARAFDPEVLKPYVSSIAGRLLVVIAFDREMSCRKAASATFQEHVGRQGAFPHGIDILQKTDYFAVHSRKNTYLNISIFVAQYPEYTKQMIDHLLDRKIQHVDPEIRILASEALCRLTAIDPKYMLVALEKIIPSMHSTDLNARHGALLSIGEIIHGLANESASDIELGDGILSEIEEIVPTFYRKSQFRGVGGDLNKEACCHLITKCSLAKLKIRNDIIDCWLRLMNDCLSYESSKVRSAGARALSTFSMQYCLDETNSLKKDFGEQLQKYSKEVISNNEISRLGHAQMLGLLPSVVLKDHLVMVIDSLVECTSITKETALWAACRKEAIDALVLIWRKFCVESKDTVNSEICLNYVLPLLHTFRSCLSDYTLDKRRGDIGSTVRDSAIKAIEALITSIPEKTKDLIPVADMEELLASIAQQTVERISNIRRTAVAAFINILFSDIPDIRHKSEIRNIFNQKFDDSLWHIESQTFSLFAQLFRYPAFAKHVLGGFIKTIGGITESSVTYACQSFNSYLEQCTLEELNEFCKNVVCAFRTSVNEGSHIKCNVSFLSKFLTIHSVKRVIEDNDNPFAEEIFDLMIRQLKICRDTSRITTSIEVFSHLMQAGGNVSKGSLEKLCSYLCHRMGWLRKAAALNLIEALMMYSDRCGVPPENEDEIMEILTSYDWQCAHIDQIRSTKNYLSSLLGISIPKIVSSVTTNAQ